MEPLQSTRLASLSFHAQTLFVEGLNLAAESHPDVFTYLSSRPGTDIARRYGGLGLGLNGYSRSLMGAGWGQLDLEALGLIDRNGAEIFAGRLTFPWVSLGGAVLAGFGGRTFLADDRRTKYANSPEKPWFSKSRILYGTHAAAFQIHTHNCAIVVEGVFDTYALWSWGWANTVATVGAKITEDQLTLLARLTDNIVLLFDDDEGGARGVAALDRTLQVAQLPASVEVRVAHLEGGKDPAESEPAEVAVALANSLPLQRAA